METTNNDSRKGHVCHLYIAAIDAKYLALAVIPSSLFFQGHTPPKKIKNSLAKTGAIVNPGAVIR